MKAKLKHVGGAVLRPGETKPGKIKLPGEFKPIDMRPPGRLALGIEKYDDTERWYALQEDMYYEPYDLVMAQRNIMPNLMHGIPTQEWRNEIAWDQFTNQHYSEKDLLADIKYSIKDTKHRRDHHPIVKKVVSESFKHSHKLHSLYFENHVEEAETEYEKMLAQEDTEKDLLMGAGAADEAANEYEKMLAQEDKGRSKAQRKIGRRTRRDRTKERRGTREYERMLREEDEDRTALLRV